MLKVLTTLRIYGQDIRQGYPYIYIRIYARDIWGRLVYLAAVQNLELEYVMSYPMTIVLLSLAHIHGALNRTDKLSLMRKLKKSLIKSGILDKQNGNVCLIDFIYFLWMLPPQLAATFGEVTIFHADTVHIICDAYFNEPTIKDPKRDRRENTEATYSIQGCDQTRPTYFNSTLLSTSFKSALIDFLAYEFRSQHYKDIINEKTVCNARKQ